MTLVDTTVWIDFFRNADTLQGRELERLIQANEDVCICGVILTEVLQGIRDDLDYSRTRSSFEAFVMLPMSQHTFVRAADLYRTLRRRGHTIRNAVDCMIEAVAIEHDVPLLHNDRDYEAIALLGTLKIVGAGKPARPRAARRARGGFAAGGG